MSAATPSATSGGSTPRKRWQIGGTAAGSSSSQLVTMIGVAALVFVAGILIGSQFFDPHGDSVRGDPDRPWESVTQSRMRAPPGLKAAAAEAAGLTITDPIAEAAAPSPVTAAATIAELAAKGPLSYGSFAGRSSIEFDAPLDAQAVSFGAWVYLDSRDKSSSIKTIVSNRHGGCKVDAAHRGFALMVNNWETNDRSLVLEWRNSGGSGEGCARLSSDPGTIPYDTWVHVGFALPLATAAADDAAAAAPKVMLFLNGELLKTAPGGRRPDDVQADGTSVPLALGASADRQMFFNGRIGQAFLARTIVTPRQLVAAARLLDLSGWRALAEAGKGKMLAAIHLSDKTPPAKELQLPAPGAGAAAAGADADADKDGEGGAAASGGGVTVGRLLYTTSAGIVAGDLTGGCKPVGGSAVVPAPPPALRGGDKAATAAAGAGGGAAAAVDKASIPDAVSAPSGDGSAIPASIKRTSVPGAGASSGGRVDYSKGGNQWVSHMIRVPDAKGSTSDAAALAAGTFSDDVSAEELAASDELGRTRAAAVKAAMTHAWSGYKAKAWGFDELKPRGGFGQDNWAGVGMTLVDSLDTLWVMGMMEEFKEAQAWVASRLSFDKHASVSVFETTIRALGGLLAAYDLSGEAVFLDKAKDLGNRLLPAFNTPTGIPRASIVLATGQASAPGWTGGASILAELGTVQVEFRKLGAATGEALFARKAEAVIEKMDAVKPADGLFPIYVSADSGVPTTSQVTFGALGDSFYEYLLKVWLQGGRSESMYRRMYDGAMAGMTGKLLKRSRPSNLLYVADWDGGGTVDKMDHLVCFVPGMLALGAFSAAGTAGEANAVRDLTNAKALAYTCWQMYERQATGIAPEFVEFPGGGDLIAAGRAPFYILRPEAAESLFILHQLTGNPVYREWGWRMFQAIDRYCKVEYGYGAHPDVRDPSRTPDDRMER